MKSQSEIRQAVTDQIIQAIRDGGLPPWRKCFSDDPNAPGLHTSLSTGSPYRGINQLILQISAMRFGYKSKWWGTYNQVRYQNSSVRKGQKGHRIILWKPISRTRTNEQGNEIDEKFLIMREFVVFNAEQTTGLEQFQVGYATKFLFMPTRFSSSHAESRTGFEIRKICRRQNAPGHRGNHFVGFRCSPVCSMHGQFFPVLDAATGSLVTGHLTSASHFFSFETSPHLARVLLFVWANVTSDSRSRHEISELRTNASARQSRKPVDARKA